MWLKRTAAKFRPDLVPQCVDGGWEITCVNALAQDWLEQWPGTIIRCELAAVTGEKVGEVGFRAG